MEGSARGGAGAAGPLPLPPPPRLAGMPSSSPASIRALLARTASGSSGVDCQSPRSLLSRILQRGDGGGGGGGFGCRVRLPRRYCSSSGGGGGGGGGSGRKEDGGGSEHPDATPRVKVVGRSPELPLETPRSSLGKKKPEEELVSMNLLGLGASLVLLLSKTVAELNKMVELRAQMEAMVSEVREETRRKEKHSAPAASSSSSGDGGSTCTDTVIKDPIVRAAAADEEDALSTCSQTAGRGAAADAVVVMDRMEAELQIELNRLQTQRGVAGEKGAAPAEQQLKVDGRLPSLQVKTKSDAVVSDSRARSCVDKGDGDAMVDDGDGEVVEEEEEEDDEEEEAGDDDDDDEGEEEEEGAVDCKSPPHGGVSARALERRLHELLQRRQQDRIVELEAALDSAQRRLHEREREVVWWRDAANLVSHRRDESRRLIRA